MAANWRDLLDDVRRSVDEVTPAEVRQMIAESNGVHLIDVREADEVSQGRLPGAAHIPRGFLEMKIEGAVPDKDAPVVVYCAGGTRSAFAAETLKRLGYARVSSMAGGFGKWKNEGYEFEQPYALSEKERVRYARHLSIPEVGEEGQARLLQSRVLLIGAGGLGCPAAVYLAAAGVGTMGLVDFDVVDETNLQRQILHTADRVGTPKIESARKALLDFNPALKLVTYETHLDSSNVDDIFKEYEIVVDGTDNFPARYLINDACVKHKLPNVHASVYRFDGQVTVFASELGGPCYRCLYPSPPPPDMAPSCAEAGVLGVLPGVMGMLQAVETIKIILGIGEPLVGRLLTYDGLTAQFRELKLRRDPECPYCAPGREFPGYVDYELFCQTEL